MKPARWLLWLTAAWSVVALIYQLALRARWVPEHPGATLVFLHYRIPDVTNAVPSLLLIDTVWTLLLVGCLLNVRALRDELREALPKVVIVAQAAALLVMLFSPFAMDSDQYAYVYYGDLTLRHINPYPQYAQPLALQPQEAAAGVCVATVFAWAVPLGVKTSLFGPMFLWNADHQPKFSYYLWRVAAHVPLLDHLPRTIFGNLFTLAAVAVAIVIAVRVLQRKNVALLVAAFAILVLLLPYKIEAWYAIMLAPLLLVRKRWAIPLYVGITAASQWLQVRIFVAHSTPYLVFTCVALLVALTLYEFEPVYDEPRTAMGTLHA